jgi:hypothetical protein
MKKLQNIFFPLLLITAVLISPKISYATNIELEGYYLQLDKSLGFNDLQVGAKWDVIEKNCEIIEPIDDRDNFMDYFPCYGMEDYWYHILMIDGAINVIGLELGRVTDKQLQTLSDSLVNIHNEDKINIYDEYTYYIKDGQIVIQGFEDGSYILYYTSDYVAKEFLKGV